MSIFFPPPPPLMGAAQPFAPRKLPPAIEAVRVDNPPTALGGPVAIGAEIVARAQPDPWINTPLGRQAYEQRKLVPGVPGQSVDRPPPSHAGRGVSMAAIVATWQPDPWIYAPLAREAYEPRKLSPAVPGQSADPPPFALGGPVAIKAEIIARAQPDPWTFTYFGRGQPFGPPKMAPGIPGQSINNPPVIFGGPYAMKAEVLAIEQPAWTYSPWPYLFMGRGQPYGGRVAAPRLISVAVDEPPYTHRGRTAAVAAIVNSWQPPPPFFHLQLYSSRPTPQRLRPTARGYVIL